MTDVEEGDGDWTTLNAKIARLAEAVDQRHRPYEMVPLSVLMEQTLRDLRNGFVPIVLRTLFIAAVAVGVLLFSPTTRWHALALHVPAWIVLVLAIGGLANVSNHMLRRYIGRQITHYLFATQHDRAMAALRLSLVAGRPMMLYLRSFRAEEHSEESLHLERLVVDVAKDQIMVVSLLNPATDPTMRISRIAKLLYPSSDWRPMVELLCQRAERILVAASADRIDEGLADEIQFISRLGLSSKTLIVRLGEAPLDREWADRFEWNVDLPKHSLLEHDQVWGWLDMLASVAPRHPSSETVLRPHYWSRKARLLPAAIYLEGLRSLLPRSEHSLYRRWLVVPSELDPLNDVRLLALAAEKASYDAGRDVEPLDLIIRSTNPETARFMARRAEAKRLERQLETAQFILFVPAAWIRLRRMFHVCR